MNTVDQAPHHVHRGIEQQAALPVLADVDPHNPAHVLDLCDGVMERLTASVLMGSDTDESGHLAPPANVAYAADQLQEARQKYLLSEKPLSEAAYGIVLFHARFNLRNIVSPEWLKSAEDHLSRAL